MEFKKIIQTIKDKNLVSELFLGSFGLEREVLRVDKFGNISQRDHLFRNNKYIYLDFSESQIEMITPIFDNIKEANNFLNILTDIVNQNLEEEEYLWNYSMPPKINSEDEIRIAKFPNNKEEELYREYLSKVYGKKKQLISGVHYNFSFKDSFLKKIYNEINFEGNFKQFKDEIYLKLYRQYMLYEWLIIYFFGNTPLADKTFMDGHCDKKKMDGDGYCSGKFSKSIRNSNYGYKNKEDYFVNYYSVEKYVDEIQNLVEQKKIISNKEYYNSVRLKNIKGFGFLKENGVDYVELRNLDLLYSEKTGVSEKTLNFIHIFLIFLLFEDETPIEKKDIILYNRRNTSIFGEDNALEVKSSLGKDINIREYALQILNNLKSFLKDIDKLEEYSELLEEIFYFEGDSKKLRENIRGYNYNDFFVEISKKHKRDSLKKPYILRGHEDMELSTQILIKDAIKKGYDVDILDRKENFITISNGKKMEYIVQATKTSLDNYATILAMENKVVTKKILSKNSINVADGKNYTSLDDAKKDYFLYMGRKIVIKPKSTNFGLGITIFTGDFSSQDYVKALGIAFREDVEILVEDFLEGKEYRFFVLGDRVEGVLHRVPANVEGDGRLSISELVKEKNRDILRGKGYKTPLEKINLADEELLFLSQQGKNFNYVPKEGETVFLRENSNISTGGDSIDFTDEVHKSYKKLAVESSKSVGAKICGVDMMIQDISKEATSYNYGIVELNFNPAIHIHCYPYKGKNRRLGDKILNSLF